MRQFSAIDLIDQLERWYLAPTDYDRLNDCMCKLVLGDKFVEGYDYSNRHMDVNSIIDQLQRWELMPDDYDAINALMVELALKHIDAGTIPPQFACMPPKGYRIVH